MQRKREQVYIYHKDESPKLILKVRLKAWQGWGWKDSPIHFIKTTDFGIEPEDDEKVQALGQALQGVRDFCNCLVNISIMDKSELADCVRTHFDSELGLNTTVKSMRQHVRGLFHESSSHN